MRDWAVLYNMFYKQMEPWQMYLKNITTLSLAAGNKMFALMVKKLYVTSSLQCYFKSVSQKNAEMSMHHLLAYPKCISDL